MAFVDVETDEEKVYRLMAEDMMFEVSDIGDREYFLECRRKEEDADRKAAAWRKHLEDEKISKRRGRGRGRGRGQGQGFRCPSVSSDGESEDDSTTDLEARQRKNRELAKQYMAQNESYKYRNEYLEAVQRKVQQRAKKRAEQTSEPTGPSECELPSETEEKFELAPEEVQPRQSESTSTIEPCEPVNEAIPPKPKPKTDRKQKNAMLMALQERNKKKDEPCKSDDPESMGENGAQRESLAGASPKKCYDGSECAARLAAILLGNDQQSSAVVKPVQEAQCEKLDVTERFKFLLSGTEDDGCVGDDTKESVSSSSSSYVTASSSGFLSEKYDSTEANFTEPTANFANLCSGDSAKVNSVQPKKHHTTSKRVRRVPIAVGLSSPSPAREYRYKSPVRKGPLNIKSASDFPSLS